MKIDKNSSDYREYRIRRNRMRRARQLRRRLLIGVCTLIIIIASSLGYTSFCSRASEAGYEDHAKVYVSVMIPYGSDLYSISSEYADMTRYDDIESYMEEVLFINHLDNADDIIAGHYLIMPTYIGAGSYQKDVSPQNYD